jgi:hypothetical protein
MSRTFLLLGAGLFAMATDVGAEPLTLKEAAAARKVYVAKCAKCHKFYEPRNYSDADWTRWMGLMSQRAKLKADQAEGLKRYLAEYRAGTIAKVR